MDIKKNDKFIYTDSYRTKDLIWEAYTGFTTSYNNKIMLLSMGREDPIENATVIKYANYFYDEIKDFINSFSDEIGKKKCEQIKAIFSNQTFVNSNFKIMRSFFSTFMKVSGIKNIVKDKDDINTSVTKNR